MLIQHNPDDYEIISGTTICAFHKLHPGKTFAGCTCSGYIAQRKKDTKPVIDQIAEPLEDPKFDPTIHLPEKL